LSADGSILIGTDDSAGQEFICAVKGVGLPRAAGSQQFIDGPTGRLLDMSAMLGSFTVAATGLVDLGFGGLASAGIGALSLGAQYLPWTNLTSTVTGTYPFNVLLPAPSFAAPPNQAVWLDPAGATHRAGFSSSPARFASGTLVSVRGAGLATTTMSVSTVPFLTTLGGTQLLD